MTITIREFQAINKTRGQRWHHGNLHQWSLLEWAGAMAGEAGEACNAAKKIRRLDLDLPNREAGVQKSDLDLLKQKLACECADTIIYALLILSAMDMDATSILKTVFNQKSVEYGFPELIK